MRKFISILFALVLVCSFSLVAAVPVEAQTTYYVATTGNDANDGSSGSPRLTIQHAIDTVIAGDTINVAAGTYVENITLKDRVEVLGAGADVTTINGGGSGSVVTANGVSSTTKLDGFTITNGSADFGGGMCNTGVSSPTVSGCTFSGNSATSDGGGMCNTGVSSPTVSGCTFSGNSAAFGGGGMYNEESSPVVTSCTFSGNSAAFGGGMENLDSSPVVTNCTFSGNSAAFGGGGMENHESSPVVTNCTFSGNSADYGGGMCNSNYSSPTVTNCIFWGDAGGEIYHDYVSTPAVTYCDVQGGYSGTGNINQNPLFVDAGAGDFHLQAVSPCIDVGDNAAATAAGLTTDFEGDPRIVDGDGDTVATVDMGADERVPTEVWVDDNFDPGTPGWGYDHFATILEGVDAVAPGGTVHVHPGTYYEKNITIDKSLTVESVSGDWHDTVVDPATQPVFEFTSGFTGDATISGFTITAGTYGIKIDGLDSGSSVTINNCLIYGNGTGIYGCGPLGGDIFVNNCIIADNGWPITGIHLDYVAGTVEITDSFIGAYWDAETSTSYSGNAGNGIEISEISVSGNVLIDNNKIVENAGNGIDDGITGGCFGQLTITNNIIGAYDYDLTSEYGYFTGNGNHGISIDCVAENGVVTIEANRIADNYYDGICFGLDTIYGEVTINNNYIGAWTDYTTVGDVLYTRTFTGNGSKGIHVADVEVDGSLVIINNKVAENAFVEPDYTGIYIGFTSGKTVISANHVGSWTQDIPGGDPITYQGNGGPGIRVEHVAGGSLLIHGNTVAGNIEELRSGIHIELAVDTADVSVNLNNILNNDGYGVYYNYGGAGCLLEIDAENNWWGDTSGPGGEGPGTGDEVSTNVDYEPWLEVSVEDAKAGTITDGTLDATETMDTEVIVDGSTIVTVAEYASNPGGTPTFSAISKYVDVHIDDPSGVTEITIRVYYTAAEVAGRPDEALLKLNWFNGTSWVECSDSGVTYPAGGPTYRGYMWAKIRSDTTPNLTQLSLTPFGGGPPIPTLTQWGIIGMTVLFGCGLVWAVRRRQTSVAG